MRISDCTVKWQIKFSSDKYRMINMEKNITNFSELIDFISYRLK